MAHTSPFARDAEDETWRLLYQGRDLGRPDFSHDLSGWTACSGSRHSPPYFNTGMICAPAAVLANFHERYQEALRFVRSRLDNYFFEQIAMTLALDKTPFLLPPLPLRYNFPNQAEFDAANPVELKYVRFLHFLRVAIVNRERDFIDQAAMRNLAGRVTWSDPMKSSGSASKNYCRCLTEPPLGHTIRYEYWMGATLR